MGWGWRGETVLYIIFNSKNICIKGHRLGVKSLVRLPNGELASASLDYTIIVWNVQQAQVKFRLNGHTDHVWSMALLSHGLLASGSSDSFIIVWDYLNGEEKIRLKGHQGNVNTLCWTRECYLVSGASDHKVVVWDFNNENLKQAVGIPVTQTNVDGNDEKKNDEKDWKIV
jgi:WD40 repeat protein